MVSEKAPKGARDVIAIETQESYQSVLLEGQDSEETWKDIQAIKIDLHFRRRVTQKQGDEIVAFFQKNGAAVIYWR